MTATIDALGRGTAPIVKPGERFQRVVHASRHDRVTLRLLPAGAHTGFLGALCVPDDLYWVSRTPVALAGMSYPGRADWSLLARRASATSCASRTTSRPTTPRRAPSPRCELQDLVSGDPPDDPERERELVIARRRRRRRAHRARRSASPCTAWAGAAAPEP